MKNPFDSRRKSLFAAGAVLAAMGVVCALAWGPIVKAVENPEHFRAWIESCGPWGRVVFVGLVTLQIVVAILPGEPLEIAAGYAFGAWEGTALCLLGCLIGGVGVFLLVRKWGYRIVEPFCPREKLLSLRLLRDPKRLTAIAFLLFLIPGTPKDVMTYAAGLTRIKLSSWILITSVARVPSIVTSTIGGDALGLNNLPLALWVFAATALASAAGFCIYRHWNRGSRAARGK